MKSIITYFLTYSRLNYVILGFIFFMGVTAYTLIPKEVFPDVTDNTIVIKGSYAGASPQSLDSFAVTEIENEIKAINGISEIESVIRQGTFTIKALLYDDIDPNEIIDEFKDAVALARSNLPSDMDEPTVTKLKRDKPLLNVILASPTLDRATMMQHSKRLQSLLLGISDVSDVIIYGESDMQVDIFIDDQKAAAMGLDTPSIASAISNLSYIFPLGTIDQRGNHLYLSAQNSKTDAQEWRDTLVSINGKKFYLSDVASIEVGYPTRETLSRYDTKTSLDLNVLQGETGDAMQIAKEVKALTAQYEKEHSDITLAITSDRSKRIKDRLDIVISNILLGLILVGGMIYFMVSPRLSWVIIMGVPFSFIITIILLYYLGYTINMITLLALLITIGIVVDDAIIVSENIQRHVDDGMELDKAVIKGALEVVGPVLVASATTIFAFMPLLMLSGRMGEIMLMVPVVVSIAIAASLLESFLFLPLHAKHLVKRHEKAFDWSPIYTAHSRMLHFFVHYKKSFLAIFVVVVPFLTYLSIKMSDFQFFPRLDADDLTLSFQLDKSLAIEDTDAVARRFEALLLEHKKSLYIKGINTTVGHYRSIDGNSQNIENAFTLKADLEDYDEDNWIDNYLNPLFSLSFDFAQEEQIRKEKSNLVEKRLRKLLIPLIKENNITDFNVKGQRIGVVKTDIAIDLSGTNTSRIIESMQTIKAKLATIDGVVDITDNANMGKDEYVFAVNAYGQSLGITDAMVASTLANFYMERSQANTLHPEGVVEIKTQLADKDDIDSLKRLRITTNTLMVDLIDVVDITIKRDFEKIEKRDTITSKTVYANVKTATITASEALAQIEPLLESINGNGVTVSIGGEKEQTQQMAGDMTRAWAVALFLIFIVLLINFNSFKAVFIIISVIPFTILGAIVGHFIMGMNLTFPSIIGILGLAGVVINDGIVMLDFLKHTKTLDEFYERVKLRVRPILITSLTTLLGLATLIFYPTGQGVFLQPLAISLGFGLLWGTVLNLFYLPALFALLHNLKRETK
ncbi:MAG: hypothetical protein KU37_02980 [Sulfuricurvum sp. PC08-66]|nr:MAG: hypothetical protein KU37_02980 [Sulfuricurvum sp. PC08-66]